MALPERSKRAMAQGLRQQYVFRKAVSVFYLKRTSRAPRRQKEAGLRYRRTSWMHGMDIGALPRRRHSQIKRIGTHSALVSRSAIPWRFNRSLTASRYFRLPSKKLAKALDLKNTKLFGYDFAKLRDCRILIPLSCTHGKPHHESAALRRLPRSLTRKY